VPKSESGDYWIARQASLRSLPKVGCKPGDDNREIRTLETAHKSPLDPSPIAPLTPYDLASLLKGAFAFTVFALLFLFAGILLHIVSRIRWSSLPDAFWWAPSGGLRRTLPMRGYRQRPGGPSARPE
jgi:hypothetical protein